MAFFGKKCSRCGSRTQNVYQDVPTCEPCETEIKAKVKADAEAPRPCPIDKTPMAKEIVQAIVIDRCPTCRGVWLDGGELEYIKRGLELGAARAVLQGVAYPV